jgi:hypothetical protein
VANSLGNDGAVGDGLILRQLAAGHSSPVLVADFQAFSSAPRLSALLSARIQGRPMYQVDPLGALSQERPYISLAELAADAVGSFLRSGPADGRVVVVGYCSAAALALHIATLLAGSHKAAALLLRPTWPDDEFIKRQFATLAANLSAEHRPCPPLNGDPGRCVAGIEQALQAELEVVATSQGLDASAEVFGELLLTYRAWLAFLLACRNDSPSELAGEAGIAVTVLTDAPEGIVVPGLPPAACEVSRLPVLDEANPVTPEVADLVAAKLADR